MSITLTTDTVNARVQVTVTGLPPSVAGATVVTAIIQRSTDQIRWTTIRNGAQATIDASGNVATISDYEYSPGVVNFYRAGVNTQVVDTFSRTSATTWSSADTGQAWVRSSGVDADFAVGAGVGTQSHGAVNTLKGQIIETNATDMNIVVDVSVSVATALTSNVVARIAGRYTDGSNFYYARLDLDTAANVILNLVKNVAGTTIVLSSLTVGTGHAANEIWRVKFDIQGTTIRAKAWKPAGAEPAAYQLSWTPAVGDTTLAAGTKMAALARLESGNTNVLPVIFSWDNLFVTTTQPVFTQSANITPTQTQVWLKSPSRPFLNRAVTVVGWSDIQRPDRGDSFDVVGRSLPVGVTDVRGSKNFTLQLYTATADDAQTMDYVMASGDVLFIHVPYQCPVPGGYVRVATTTQNKVRPRGVSRVHELPVAEVAAPGPDVAGTISTWQTVLNSYATWSALLAANPTWADLLARIAPPSEVVVP